MPQNSHNMTVLLAQSQLGSDLLCWLKTGINPFKYIFSPTATKGSII